jgi:hypothetical protein
MSTLRRLLRHYDRGDFNRTDFLLGYMQSVTGDNVGEFMALTPMERAFERLPVLADALEDAGCANQDILAHCREQGKVHVRDCWVLSLLLGDGRRGSP